MGTRSQYTTYFITVDCKSLPLIPPKAQNWLEHEQTNQQISLDALQSCLNHPFDLATETVTATWGKPFPCSSLTAEKAGIKWETADSGILRMLQPIWKVMGGQGICNLWYSICKRRAIGRTGREQQSQLSGCSR